jgi:AcrR family transcriptional regulator
MSTVARGAVGRPRDPQIEHRVLAAAGRVITRSGLKDFSYEAVAREAGVGKPALYLRWKSKQELLLDALAQRTQESLPNTGDFRADLIQFVAGTMRDLITQRDMVTVRVMMEAVTDPASSAEYHARVIDPFREQASEMVRRAIERGELALQTPVDRVFELVWGATLTHVMVTPSQHRDAVLDAADAYATDVVDVVLAGMRARLSAG